MRRDIEILRRVIICEPSPQGDHKILGERREKKYLKRWNILSGKFGIYKLCPIEI